MQNRLYLFIILIFVLVSCSKLQYEAGPKYSDYLIQVVAGNGTAGYSGDGGPAVAAQLSSPNGIAAYNGYIYFIDSYTMVRRFKPGGNIETIAGGGGTAYYPGVNSRDAFFTSLYGITVKNDIVYVSDDVNGQIYYFPINSGPLNMLYGGLNAIKYIYPFGDYIYAVLGGAAPVIMRINTISVFSETVAGNWSTGYSGENSYVLSSAMNAPEGIVYANGYFYYSEGGNAIIRRFQENGYINTVAGVVSTPGYNGDLDALSAQISNSIGNLRYYNGYIYFSDRGNNIIRRFKPGGKVETIAGIPGSSGGDIGLLPKLSKLGFVSDIVIMDGFLYFANETGDSIMRFRLPD